MTTSPPLDPIEVARLAELQAYDVLDTAPDPALDGLTQVAAALLGVPMVLVSLVDANRQWFKSRVGLDATETPRDISFCTHVVARRAPLVVEDASKDPLFRDNPLVTGPPHVACYMGMPLVTPTGAVLGTLCAIDHTPRQFSDTDRRHLANLAAAVMAHLELQRQLRLLEDREQLLQEQAYFFDQAVDLHCLLTADGACLRLNRRWEEVLGCTEDERLSGAGFLRLRPEDEAITKAAFDGLRTTGTLAGLRNRFRHADGRDVWLEWNAVLAPSGRLILATARDITRAVAQDIVTQRRSAILGIIANHQRLELDGDVNQGAWAALLQDLIQVTGSAYGFIGMVHRDADGPYLRSTAISDISWDDATRALYKAQARTGMVFRNQNTLFGRVLTTGQTVIANDVAHDARAGGRPNGHPPLNKFLGLPIGEGEQMVGMIGLANRIDGYDADFVDELLPLRNFLFTVFENLALASTRARALEELSAARWLQERILRASTTGIVALREDGTVALANPRATSMLPGLTEGERVRFDGCLPAAEGAWFRATLANGGEAEREFDLPTPHNGAVRCALRVKPMGDEGGQSAGVLVTLTDVSGQRALEASARTNASLEARVAELREQQRANEVLAEAVDYLQNSSDGEEPLQLVFRAVCRLFPTARVAVYAGREAEPLLTLQASKDQDAPLDLRAADCWGARLRRIHGDWPGGHGITCRHGPRAADRARFCVPLLGPREQQLLIVVEEAAGDPASEGPRNEARGSQLAAMAQSLAGALSNLRLRLQLERAALTDPLTGLPNRRAFLQEAQRLVARARRGKRPFAYALLDVDHFKRINDTFGHEVGDRTLRELAHTIRETLRTSDVCGRIGGEEFAILLEEIDGVDADRRLDDLRVRIERAVRAGDNPVTASIGLVHSDDLPESARLDDFYKVADAGLYAAKHAGRNRVIRQQELTS
jgi:diguanylate cyclase (GGDEF)-like protein/PAS domain S-box-containing protein